MISLGDLNAGHTGTFVIPPGTDLSNYSRIDISLQPFNGSTQHSKSQRRPRFPARSRARRPALARCVQRAAIMSYTSPDAAACIRPGRFRRMSAREPRPSAAGMEWTCECSNA